MSFSFVASVFSAEVHHVNFGTLFKEKLYGVSIQVFDGKMQGSLAVAIDVVDVGAPYNEFAGHLDVSSE